MAGNSTAGPNLFIVGAPKCGTTSLYEYLRRHPQVFFPAYKEPNHFCPELDIRDTVCVKSRDDYLSLYNGSNEKIWRGDASTNYLVSESAPMRIKAFCQSARILIALRPPVDMMHSYHREVLRSHDEDITDFYDAIGASAARRNGIRIPRDTGIPRCLDYFAISRFALQVERYLQVFDHRAIKIVLLEDLALEPEKTFREILIFLGIDSSFKTDFLIHNETPRNVGFIEHSIKAIYLQPGVKQCVRLLLPRQTRRRFLSGVRRVVHGTVKPDPRDDELRAASAADVHRLSRLIGRDLSHWQQKSSR